MMGWEIQKAVLIPVAFPSMWGKDREPITQEVWQTVANVGDEAHAEKELKRYLDWNKDRGFFYRIADTRRPQKA